MDDELRFVRAADVAADIGRAFERQRERLRTLLPNALILHTGASSMPDAMTRGDLDVHVRVSQTTFPSAVLLLVEAYQPVHREMWTSEFAVFVVPEAEPETGIALTAIDGEHDHRFLTSWAQLRADPELIAELNALKLGFQATRDVDGYERTKSAFFTTLERRSLRAAHIGPVASRRESAAL